MKDPDEPGPETAHSEGDRPDIFSARDTDSAVVSVAVLPSWTDRSSVPASMLNPALFAVILAAAANQHEELSGHPLPWGLSFLVPPLVLHEPTRTQLPKTSRTSLNKWVADHPILIAGFPVRARHLIPHVREGIRLGLRTGSLTLVNQGSALQCADPPKVPSKAVGDLPVIVRSSGMVGRVFGLSGDAATVFSTLRVQP